MEGLVVGGAVGGAAEGGRARLVVLPLGDHVRAHVLQRARARARARGGGRGARAALAAGVQLGVRAAAQLGAPVRRRREVVVPRLVAAAAVRAGRREVRVRGQRRLEAAQVHRLRGAEEEVVRRARERRPGPERRVGVVSRLGLHGGGIGPRQFRADVAEEASLLLAAVTHGCVGAASAPLPAAARVRARCSDVEKGGSCAVRREYIQVKGVVTRSSCRLGCQPRRSAHLHSTGAELDRDPTQSLLRQQQYRYLKPVMSQYP